MTKPHTTLSEAVRALELPEIEFMAPSSWESECYARGALAMRSAAVALVEQHEAQEPKLPTDVSNRLRDVAKGGDQYCTNTANSLLRAAADEIERYYGGMMNWKASAEVKDALAATQAGDAWQPIETAPKDGTHIILWWDKASRLGWWLDNSRTAHPWAGWKVPSLQVMPFGCQPTHWMPLPSAPTTTRSE